MVDTLLSFVPSAMQLAQGLTQKKRAKNLKEDKFIPGATLEKEARARSRANQTQMPGQARAEEKMDSATTNAVSATRRNARDSTTVVEKIQEADAVKKSQIGDMNAKLADFKLRNEAALDSALSEKAGYQKRNRDQYNAAKSALEGSAATNFFNSATNAATAGILALNKKDQKENPSAVSMGSILGSAAYDNSETEPSNTGGVTERGMTADQYKNRPKTAYDYMMQALMPQ